MRSTSPQFAWLLAFALVLIGGQIRAADEIRFGRDVLPILADRCFHCHGPEETHREAELRLDLHEDALADRGGYAAVVPGKPDNSELIKRITNQDADERMPPPDSHRKPLSEREIDILRRWIASGAKWERHWAFIKPVRPVAPDSALHPIDAFVRHRLQEVGLRPSPEAPKHTLIRRLSFDLTGLPPTLEEVKSFVADDSPQAYEKVVDRLLRSPHFGERMAMWWLDSARYSDTDGFQADATRTNWPWRDWVVQAFNDNMPFDQFTTEQLAGDLLPGATTEQKLATCFHRNHMTNGEGGRDPEESRVEYVIDRTNTLGTVWLGLTLGCCQCHSHKFDPISQKDYYSLTSFFDSIDEDGRAGDKAKPYLNYKSPFVERAIKEAQVVVNRRKRVEEVARQQSEGEFEPWLVEQIAQVKNGFQPWQVLRASSFTSAEGTILIQEPDGKIQSSGPNPRQDDYRVVASTDRQRITGLRLEIFPHASHTGGQLSRGASGSFILTDVKLQVRHRGDSQLRDINIASAVADAEKDATKRKYGQVSDILDDDPRNGWTTGSDGLTQRHVAVLALAEPLQLLDDEELVFVMSHRSTRGDANIGRFCLSVTDQPGQSVRSLNPMPMDRLAAARATSPAEIDDKLRSDLLEQFLADHVGYQRVKAELDRANRQLNEVKKAGGELQVMILAERTDLRKTFVLKRGVWDKHGEEVSRTVPGAVLAWPNEKTQTRLDLANWLVSRDNPLTARVVANQLWQSCFGAGLVRTPEDFGLQGELPTHPELLDWLAVELMEHHWDVKHILRVIVTSETYRQSSDFTPELLQRDPDNRLLARGARFRLQSWMIRDAALHSSGLLNLAVGGPPVRPYQPDGVWEEMFMGRFHYEPSEGPPQFRRTLYAFWRRSAAPTFLFDNAQRRLCEVHPRQTNTPLHALTLWNDLNLLEASREIARSALAQQTTPKSRIDQIFRHIVSRSPTETEMGVLTREFDQSLQHYASEPSDAQELLRFGQPELQTVSGGLKSLPSPKKEGFETVSNNPAELAAYMVVGSMILNLDEAITHE